MVQFGDPMDNRVNRFIRKHDSKPEETWNISLTNLNGTITLFFVLTAHLLRKVIIESTKMYAETGDKKALIPAEITIDGSEDAAEIIRLDGQDHNVDCNYRTSQATDDRFKAAFHAGEKWAKIMSRLRGD